MWQLISGRSGRKITRAHLYHPKRDLLTLAELSGKIAEGDTLVSIDGTELQARKHDATALITGMSQPYVSDESSNKWVCSALITGKQALTSKQRMTSVTTRTNAI